MPNFLQLVGNKIRTLRKSKNLSQEQLGELSGFHFTYIGGLERGERNISLENLEKIAQSLGVQAYELLQFDSSIDNEKDALLTDIMYTLSKQDITYVKMAKNILLEIFSTIPSSQPEDDTQ